MKKPIFSIIIPTYNQCDYLNIALKSVINQKFSNYEIIVIDNFSNDKTNKVVENFKSKNIVYKKINNHGVIGKSRNEGIKLSSGKWIAFLDSDDIWHEEKLQKIYEMIKKRNFDVVCNDEYWIYKNKNKNKKIARYGPFKKNFYKYLLESGNCLSTSGSVVKKSFLEENKIDFSERKDFITAEDYDFFLKIAEKNGIFFFLHLPLGEHLFHDRSASSNFVEHKKSWKAVLEHHVFKVQKFDYNKKKIMNKCNLNITIMEFIIKLKNKEISLNLYKKIFTFLFFNPIFSFIFVYKKIIRKIVQIYSSVKYV